MAELIRCISENGGVLVTALDSTEIVERMFCIHHTSPVCSAIWRSVRVHPSK